MKVVNITKIQTQWEDFFNWCIKNSYKPSNAKALSEYIKGEY